MIIHEMTATFGKLSHETISFHDGLNIVSAPNEWGKSTWCAFLCAMLYGIDTRAKSTKTSLADKERYAPWSGEPMAGKIDLTWNGRKITIQRSTKGRVPLNVFRAYETDSGLDVPELTAENCGQTLLGVEQSVFRRTCFISFRDLPVTRDEALRRRLNELVTTGDESGDGDHLAASLRDLKNKCRHNRTGLLPQAQKQQEAFESTLRELDDLRREEEKLKTRLGEVSAWRQSLQNHELALHYTLAKEDAARVAQAQEDFEQSRHATECLERECAVLPGREEAERRAMELRDFCRRWDGARLEEQMLPKPPEPPQCPPVFAGKTPEEAREMVRADGERFRRQKPILPLLIAGIAAIVAGAVLWQTIPGVLLILAGCAMLLYGVLENKRHRGLQNTLAEKYGVPAPEDWERAARDYGQTQQDYTDALSAYRASRMELDSRLELLRKERDRLCGGQSPEEALNCWQQALAKWDEYHTARRECQKAQSHLASLRSMARAAQPPVQPDPLTYSREETARLLSDAGAEIQRLGSRLGQYQGRMDALGQREALTAALAEAKDRVRTLERYEAALTLAQESLAEASAQLQRRFSPRIARSAQEILSRMTGGRYTRLTLGEDFSLSAEAQQEDVTRSALWRSDGTVDQLYLALRLAASQALVPDAPLILDDALVRFDDTRLRAAMDTLRELSAQRQVILFSCQGRERGYSQEASDTNS